MKISEASKKEHMNSQKIIQQVISRFCITFFSIATAGILLLLVTGLIPQKAITPQIESSAAYFSNNELFPFLIPEQFNTRQDNYADCILINIIYHIGQKSDENLFSSLMKASYYQGELEEVNVSLQNAVDNPLQANTEYSRYWHGTMILLRPLLVLTDIQGIRILLGFLALLLAVSEAVLLWTKKQKAFAVCYLLGMVCVNSWMLLFCVEYVTTFIVMGGISLWVLLSYKETTSPQKRFLQLVVIMTVSGVLTCFFDFLTTETITLTIPLLLELILSHEKTSKELPKPSSRFLSGGLLCLIWGVSYAGMFLLKWLIAMTVSGKQAFWDALSQAETRLGGTVYLGNTNLTPEANLGQRLQGAFFRNQCVLFPFRETLPIGKGILFLSLILLIILSIIYLFYKRGSQMQTLGLALLLGIIPYIRYLVLSNHSYIHYFFTYRAQLVTWVALFYLCWEYGLRNIRKK